MDIFAHALWTNAVFFPKVKKLKPRLWTVFFGVAPDFVSFIPLFFYLLTTGQFGDPRRLGLHNWATSFAVNSYQFTHSLVIFASVFLLVALVRKGKPYWPLLGWALHVLLDIPSHRGFYETPFLFPLSDYRFSHGMSWGKPIFMLVNYSSLLLVYLLIFLHEKRKKRP